MVNIANVCYASEELHVLNDSTTEDERLVPGSEFAKGRVYNRGTRSA